MGLITKALTLNAAPGVSSVRIPIPTSPVTSNTANYQTYARAYATNEIVYAAVSLLSASAAEPHIIGKRRLKSKSQIRAQMRLWSALRVPNRAGERIQDAMLVRNGHVEELPDHPLITLLNNPNPFMSRGQMWSTVTMDRKLGGNAYLLKARGILGNVMELWRLRPDRVKIVADTTDTIAYEYRVGQEVVRFARRDIIHFKENNPFDEYYGMPPLLPAMSSVTIDSYFTGFLRTFFERGGTGPGSILSTTNELDQEAKDDIRERFGRQFGGAGGWHEMLILDNTGTTYQRLGLDRGLRDALPKDIDARNEARIAMVFGIPGSILGLLIGYESSSYANKRQDWQVLWDVTMTPYLSDLDDTLNLTLVPEFTGIDEVCFDLSEIKALQEDVDAIHKRARDNVIARIWTLEHAREVTGVGEAQDDEHYLLPTGSLLRAGDIDAEAAGGDVQQLALNGAQIASLITVLQAVTTGELAPDTAKGILRASFPSLDDREIDEMVDSAAEFVPDELAITAPALPAASARAGRPPLQLDSGAKTIWAKAQAYSQENPRLTLEVLAGLVGVSVSTLKRYKATFGRQN